MSTSVITTVVKMLEALPEPRQALVVEHLRDYIAALEDEAEWDRLVEKTQPGLVQAAQRARRQIAESKARPLDPAEL